MNNKELTPLKALNWVRQYEYVNPKLKEKLDIIETALKEEYLLAEHYITYSKKQNEVLKIIKEFIRIGFIKISFKTRQNFAEEVVAYYVLVNGLQYRCKTKAEFDLLKEIFE